MENIDRAHQQHFSIQIFVFFKISNSNKKFNLKCQGLKHGNFATFDTLFSFFPPNDPQV